MVGRPSDTESTYKLHVLFCFFDRNHLSSTIIKATVANVNGKASL